jgi:hypothetical protein
MEEVEAVFASLRKDDSLTNADLIRLEQENQVLSSSSEDSESDLEEEDDGTINIDKIIENGSAEDESSQGNNNKSKKKTITVEPHIDPTLFVCKDALTSMHLLLNSRTLPGVKDTNTIDTFGFGGTKKNRWRDEKPKDDTFWNIKTIRDETLNIHHPVFGIRSKFPKSFAVFNDDVAKKDKALVNHVIKGVPVKSCLYRYTMKISRKWTPSSFDSKGHHDVWICDSFELTPIPINRLMLDFLVYTCVGLPQDEAIKFTNAIVERHPELSEGHYMEFTWADYTYGMSKTSITRLDDYAVPELIRYIYCNQVKDLKKYYSEKILLNMKPNELLSLHRKINTEPFELFIFKMAPYKFRLCKKLRDKNSVANEDNKKGPSMPIESMQDTIGEEVADEDDPDAEEDATSDMIEQLVFNRDIVAKNYVNWAQKNEVFWLYFPELTGEHLNELEEKMTDGQKDIIRIYSRVKQETSENHSFVSKDILRMQMTGCATLEEQDNRFDIAIKWLTKTSLRNSSDHNKYSGYIYTPLKELQEGIYPRSSHLHVMSIIDCIRLLFDRYINFMTKTDDNDSAMLELKTVLGGEADKFILTSVTDYIEPAKPKITDKIVKGLCSEQLFGLYLHEAAPLMVVTGGAGSGKTTFLQTIAQCYREDEVLALTLQGSNMSQLAKYYGVFALTIHNAIYMHYKSCVSCSWCTSNVFRKTQQCSNSIPDLSTPKTCNKIHFKRCPFENIRVVVIDEMSLVDDELFGIILSILMKCSKVTKIIISGDHRQLPSLGCGQPLKEIKAFCDHMGLTVEFKHNHRTDENSKIIHTNLQAILEKRPYDVEWSNEDVFRHVYLNTGYFEKSFWFGEATRQVVEQLGFDQYNHMVIARSRNVVDSVNLVLDKYFRGVPCNEKDYTLNATAIYPNSKVFARVNLYLLGNIIVNNELCKVLRIEDCDVREKRKRNEDIDPKDKKKINIIENLCSHTKELQQVKPILTTAGYPTFQGAKRRIVMQPIDSGGLAGGDVIKYFPFVGGHRKKISMAYGTTIHGAQGKEYPHVIGLAPYDSRYWTNEALYTLVSRSQVSFTWLGSMDTFNAAVMRSEPPRFTELGKLMIQFVAGRVPEGWMKWMAPPIYDNMKYLEENEDLHDFDSEPSQEIHPAQEPMKDASEIAYENRINVLSSVLYDIIGYTLDDFRYANWVFTLRGVCKSFKAKIDTLKTWYLVYNSYYKNTEFILRYNLIQPQEFSQKYKISGGKDDIKKAANYVINNVGYLYWMCQSECCEKKKNIITSGSLIALFREAVEANHIVEMKKLSDIHYSADVMVTFCGVALKEIRVFFKKVKANTVKDWTYKGEYLPTSASIVTSFDDLIVDTDLKLYKSHIRNFHPTIMENKINDWKKVKDTEEEKKKVANRKRARPLSKEDVEKGRNGRMKL